MADTVLPDYRLELYIAGRTADAEQAICAIHRLCEALDYRLEVIDAIADPARAETECILITPTLIRQHPRPQRRLIGDLSQLQQVHSALQLPGVPRP